MSVALVRPMEPAPLAASDPSQRLREHTVRNLEGYYGPENLRNVLFQSEVREGDSWKSSGTLEVRDYLIFGEKSQVTSAPKKAEENRAVFLTIPFECEINLRTGDGIVHTRRMDDALVQSRGLTPVKPRSTARRSKPRQKRRKSRTAR